MPVSLVDQYERILATDPRSMVFLELARALLARGEAAAAAETCRRGLAHHPQSIQGRVVLGKALLASGEVEGAVSEFAAAAAVEPGNPYALNLAAEALADRGLFGHALPLLERAAALQPGNARIRAWLEEARRAEPVDPSFPPAPLLSDLPPDGPASAGSAEGESGGACATGVESLAAEVAATPEGLPGRAAGEVEPPSDAPEVTPPPLRRAPPPVPAASPPPERGLLGELPQPEPAAPSPPPPRADAAEAERIASTYEHQLRAELLAAIPPEKAVPRRQFLAFAGATAAALAVAGGIATYFAVRHAHRVEDARELVERARRGILRDTDGSLREASRALAEARSLDPKNPLARSLAAISLALRWADHRDAEARLQAEALLGENQAGDAAPAVRFLLAGTDAERAEAAAALAGSPSTPAGSAEAPAAAALALRGDSPAATRRLEGAARANPPSVRALVALGDLALARGEPEQALPWLAAALAAHPTHPGAAVASAEARLALHRDLGEALGTLRAVEQDGGSPPPVAERLRFELAMARVLAANGQRPEALERLERDAGRFGTGADLPLAAAEIELAAGACDQAERAARRALTAGGGLRARVLLARAQACGGRYAELLRSSTGQEARELKVARAEALLALGSPKAALAEVETTGRGGRMPADAAAVYALALDALGRGAQARAVLDRLVAMEHPPGSALLAAAQVARRDERPDDAERLFRRALEQDPDLVEAHCGLGRLLLARGRAPEAGGELVRATTLAPSHAEALVALGQARLAAGDARSARQAFSAALALLPASGPALRGLAEAELADGNPAAARRSADRALRADPKASESWLTAARVALAQGDRKAAARLAGKARKIAGKGRYADEAERLLEQARHG